MSVEQSDRILGERFDFTNRSDGYQTQSILLNGATDIAGRFETDRKNILENRAWTRLKGIYQFAINYSDSRLINRQSHSIQVKDTAEEIAKRLGLGRESQLLAGNIGLVHDIGHPPFAHWGQMAINKSLQSYGLNWNHDTAGVRILTDWAEDSQWSPTFIEGVVKRFWRYDPNKPCSFYNHDQGEIPDVVKMIDKTHDGVMKFDGFNHIEGQIAAQSDRLSFNVTDLEDGLRIGRFTPSMIKKNFPFAWNILDQTVNRFITESTIIIPFDGNIDHIYDDIDIMGFIYQRFAVTFREALMQDLLDNTRANLRKAIDSGLIHHAEDIRNLHEITVEFSSTLNEQFKKYARFCRESIFTTTAPFEHLVSATITNYQTGKVSLPHNWQKVFNQTKTDAERIELIAKYLTCELTDRDVINHVYQYSPDVYRDHCPAYESILDTNLTFDGACQRLIDSMKKDVGVRIISADELDFGYL